MPAPTHTPGQSTLTAVQLVPVYPSDSLFPSDTAYPDATYASVGPLAAALVAVVNTATLVSRVNAAPLAPRVNDAHLLATSFGGAALTPTAALIQLT